jgi:hypothetical protein
LLGRPTGEPDGSPTARIPVPRTCNNNDGREHNAEGRRSGRSTAGGPVTRGNR